MSSQVVLRTSAELILSNIPSPVGAWIIYVYLLGRWSRGQLVCGSFWFRVRRPQLWCCPRIAPIWPRCPQKYVRQRDGLGGPSEVPGWPVGPRRSSLEFFHICVVENVLVNAASCCLDALLLGFITWFMITRQIEHLLALLSAHDGSRVTHIGNVARITHHQRHYGTWSTAFGSALSVPLQGQLQEALLGCLEALPEGVGRVAREVQLSNDELVQIVTQKVGTSRTSMAIIHTKEGTLGPSFGTYKTWWCESRTSTLRFDDVEDDRNAVFVVIAHDALVGVGSIGLDDAIAIGWTFCGLVVGQGAIFGQYGHILKWMIRFHGCCEVHPETLWCGCLPVCCCWWLVGWFSQVGAAVCWITC